MERSVTAAAAVGWYPPGINQDVADILAEALDVAERVERLGRRHGEISDQLTTIATKLTGDVELPDHDPQAVAFNILAAQSGLNDVDEEVFAFIGEHVSGERVSRTAADLRSQLGERVAMRSRDSADAVGAGDSDRTTSPKADKRLDVIEAELDAMKREVAEALYQHRQRMASSRVVGTEGRPADYLGLGDLPEERAGTQDCPCSKLGRMSPAHHDWLLSYEERGLDGVIDLIDYLEAEAGDEYHTGLMWMDFADFVALHNWREPAAVHRIARYIEGAIRGRRSCSTTARPSGAATVSR
jgi:hypothetical protein